MPAFTLHIPPITEVLTQLAGSKHTTGADKNSYSMIPFLNFASLSPLREGRIKNHCAFTLSTSSRSRGMLSRCSSSPHFRSRTSHSRHSSPPSIRQQMAAKHTTSSFPRFLASVSATRLTRRHPTHSSLLRPTSSTTSCQYWVIASTWPLAPALPQPALRTSTITSRVSSPRGTGQIASESTSSTPQF